MKKIFQFSLKRLIISIILSSIYLFFSLISLSWNPFVSLDHKIMDGIYQSEGTAAPEIYIIGIVLISSFYLIYTLYEYYLPLFHISNKPLFNIANQFAFFILYNLMFFISLYRTLFTKLSTIPDEFPWNLPLQEVEELLKQNKENKVYIKDNNKENSLNTISVSCSDYVCINQRNNDKLRFCTTCNKIRPDRCHHCKFCNQCYLKMDHHCIWLDKCITIDNYKFYLLLMFFIPSFKL